MFERYTEKARRVIFFARYAASQFGSPYIETEHLLLGLIREDKNISYKILSTGGHGNPQGHRRPHRSAASTSASTTARSAFGNCGNRKRTLCMVSDTRTGETGFARNAMGSSLQTMISFRRIIRRSRRLFCC